MMWFQLLISIVLAYVFGVVLVHALRWRHPARSGVGASVLFMFLMFFPFLWAASVWVAPVEPTVFGVAIIPILLLGVLLLLVAWVLTSPARVPRTGSPETKSQAGDAPAVFFGVSFWVLMLCATGVIVAGYIT